MNERFQQMSDEQLLAAFIPAESARGLLRDYSSLYNVLHRVSDRQIRGYHGMGSSKLYKMQCLREMVHRVTSQKMQIPKVLGSTQAAVRYFTFLEEKQVEEFWAVFLNTKNQAIGCRCITIGTLNASLAQPREVFAAALQYMAAAVVVAHNHPSGDGEPSSEDIEVTKTLIQAGEVLHMPLLDHIVIGRFKSVSLHETCPAIWRT